MEVKENLRPQEVEAAENCQFSKRFSSDYKKFVERFEGIVSRSLFLGVELEELTKEFMAKHQKEIEENARATSQLAKIFANCDSSSSQVLDEDMKILTNSSPTIASKATQTQGQTSASSILLADLYRRACQACYLRVTYNKSRLEQEDDRSEAVRLGRYAIRLNSQDFLASYWYMIALGWHLDVTRNPKDRTLIARLFRRSAEHCIELNPTDPLAHHLLGRYYYNVASLTWIERALAKSLLGCKLEGSFQDSEREFLRAHQLKAGWLPTGLWLARVLLAQQRPMEEVKHWIDYGLSLDCKEPSSEIERKQLLELRAELRLD